LQMGRIRGCNMAVVCAKIKVISGVLRESGGKGVQFATAMPYS